MLKTSNQISRSEAIVLEILEQFDGGAWKAAKQIWDTADLDADERVACWKFFNSKQQAFLNDRRERKYLQEFWGDD